MIHSEWYRVFMYAAQEGNLTKAAQQLHMTQPSVSYTIKQLEEALDVLLFDRLSKGVRLTEEGRLLYEHVQLAFSQLYNGEQLIRDLKQFHQGQLRVGANGAVTKDILLPKLDRFHEQYPHIRLKLVQDRTSLIVKQLKEGALDAGFVHLPFQDHELKIEQSFVQPNCFVVGKRHKELAAKLITAQELLQLPFLMLSTGSSTRIYTEQWFVDQGCKPGADIELNSMEMLAAFAERGYGVALVPRSFVENELRKGSLLELQTAVPVPDRQLGIAVRKDSSLSHAATKFLELFK